MRRFALVFALLLVSVFPAADFPPPACHPGYHIVDGRCVRIVQCPPGDYCLDPED
jgi:hypothetical protein